jgi:hypothetical protein
VLGFWTAHETGTMSGSTWFADRYWDRLRENAVAYLQIDQPACAGTTRWATSSNAELKAFHQRVEQTQIGGMEAIWKRASKTGDSSFYGLGVPMFHGEMTFTEQELKDTALASLGWWHHSLENKLDKLDWELMAVHLKVYAAWMWELCTAPVLPFRFVPVAEQIVARLDDLAKHGDTVGLAAVEARAKALVEAAGKFDAMADDWADRFGKGEGDEDAARLLNRAMKRMSRILVPLQSQVKGPYGQDSYGFTPQGTMLPCLYDLPKLAELPDQPERWMLETQLVKDRNRVADGVGDAKAVIDETLATLGKH